MPLPVSTLTVTRFRSLRNLTVGPFGRVNLITGKNNTGKSTLLEAIRLLASGGSPSTLLSILDNREEPAVPDSEIQRTTTGPPRVSSLFSDFPNLWGCADPFTVSSTNGEFSETKSVEVKVGWYSQETDPETGNTHLVPSSESDLLGETYGVPVLEIKTPLRQIKFSLDKNRRATLKRGLLDTPEKVQIPCVYVDSFSSRYSSQLGNLWDSIALTPAEKRVVEALQIIAPDIEAVSMIGSENGRRFRTAIAKSRLFQAPVSLTTFGDGVNRLFGIILSLVKAENGVLLVDEIENGLHHSILPEVWKVIFRMAAELNVQVFATTHSWDCVDAFQQAANGHPQVGVLARLTAYNGKIIPTLFSEDELRIAARDQIEVR